MAEEKNNGGQFVKVEVIAQISALPSGEYSSLPRGA